MFAEPDDSPRGKSDRARSSSPSLRCERREVAFLLVTAAAREHEVVAPVVRGLSAARRDVIERHGARGELRAAVGAHRAVLPQQPRASLDERIARRGMRRMRFTRSGRALALASPTPASGALAAGLGRRGMMRLTVRCVGLGVGVDGLLSAVRSRAVARRCAPGRACRWLAIRRIVWFSCQKLVWVCCTKDGGATFDVTPPPPSHGAD